MKRSKIISCILSVVIMAAAMPGGNIMAAQEDLRESPSDTASRELIELEEGWLEYESSDVETQQISCGELGGVYFLNGSRLSFYSLDNHTYTNVHTFDSCISAYADSGKLYVLGDTSCQIYDLIKQSTVSEFAPESVGAGTAVGADSQGRIYIAAQEEGSYKISLYSQEGALLSSCNSPGRVYSFDGFDSTNGNFYAEVARGAEDTLFPGRVDLKAGTVSDGTFTFPREDLLSQPSSDGKPVGNEGYNWHRGNAQLLGGKYLFAVDGDFVEIWDSNQDCLQLLSDINLSRNYDSANSVGIRAVFHKEHNSIITYGGNKKLVEYDLATGDRIAQ